MFDNYEKINLAHVILEQYSILDEDSNLLRSFAWADSKQGMITGAILIRELIPEKVDSLLKNIVNQ